MTTVHPARARSGTAVTALALALAVLVVVTGCATRESEAAAPAPDRVPVAELADLTLRVGDQKGGTQALLAAAGQLDDLPYQVEFSTFTSGPPQIEALNAGQIDVAVTGNTPPVFGAAAGARASVVSAYANRGEGDQILVPADSDVQSVAELAGKKVLVAKGTSAHGHLLLQLRAAGVDPQDVELVFLQPAEAGSAFSRGDADAWAIWDPYTAITQTTTDARTLVTASGVSNGFWFGVASDEALADPRRQTAIADLLVRIAEAGTWTAENPAEWADYYGEAVGVSPEAAALSQGRSTRAPVALAETIAREQDLADVFTEDGQINPVDVSELADDRFADDLAAVVGPLP
ncbi:sulfonate ABC transporter periplasmic sulfonate-binding protein SsuA [Dietzia sp. NCCP-2495]|uniref:ABC transporter substrate-binding protein n=1 Tax=Dietzia sp. NCCP-2495 TaxID=2934675 RepID=UPI0022306739|nr:ABC transporter substrate-binding protein [Dietzia sp. NCCP-2495]GLB63736.1 sulfonate ABC transporter periplasmic sulfonate-binding protein SsuA [Dietzia sp. NCCP-2495]